MAEFGRASPTRETMCFLKQKIILLVKIISGLLCPEQDTAQSFYSNISRLAVVQKIIFTKDASTRIAMTMTSSTST
jgi:hypothetical protein